jgi:hypothetical protein
MAPDLPDGLMVTRSGQVRARANRSRSQDSAPVQTIQGICGPTSFASSVPAGPLSSWESRLRDRLAMIGSTEFPLICKVKTTKQGRSISRLSPSMRRTSDSVSTGSQSEATWPTTMAGTPAQKGYNEAGNTDSSRKTVALIAGPWPTPQVDSFRSRSGDRKHEMGLDQLARFTPQHWPTPRAHEAGPDFAKRDRSKTGMDLPALAAEVERDTIGTVAAPWPTPTAVQLGNSLESYEAMKTNMKSGKRTAITSLPQMAEATAKTAWPTPTETDSSSSRRHGYMLTGHPGTTLTDAADLSTWATPAHRDYRHPNAKPLSERGGGKKGEQLPNQAAHLYAVATEPSGPTQSGSSELTAKRGALNPTFVSWLMGYPAEWVSCGASAMQLSRKKSRKSSAR